MGQGESTCVQPRLALSFLHRFHLVEGVAVNLVALLFPGLGLHSLPGVTRLVMSTVTWITPTVINYCCFDDCKIML
jgi:hypothetical protein